MSETREEVLEKELKRALLMHREAIHPGKGKRIFRFIRDVCNEHGWNEDHYLPVYMIKNKGAWQ